ncbi:MAG: 2-polyprenyl-3-methyl-5-hydroxy-6-metoxy-1,4-benzoquinol methylase [Halieaceae bacterium]|jgi:2-polyprenyl-3-methyl-5-hydroxy-6-metoxy-1,4-benzoquinol methylase
MKVSEGLKEDGIVVGNTYDKYGSTNPIVRKIMAGFHNALDELVDKANPTSIHEVGCGEGYWVKEWNSRGIAARGSDFSEKVIEIARENAEEAGLATNLFEAKSIYDLLPNIDGADLIVCCEVMEHLENPEEAFRALKALGSRNVILSVPREPVWCALNLVRFKYISSLGNTPGHIQHWSTNQFVGLASKYFNIVEIRTPLPWTMILCRPS